jgi:hypothetical protein
LFFQGTCGSVWRGGKSLLVLFQQAQGFLISRPSKLAVSLSHRLFALIDDRPSVSIVDRVGYLLSQNFHVAG